MEATSIDIRNEIRHANDKFERNFAKGDATGMASLYTEDGVLLPTGSDMIKGKNGIRDFWQGAMDMGVKEAKLETVELEQCENTAIEMGKYTLSGEGGQAIDQGKYIVIWKQENGQWKLQKDIWNSSVGAN
ncbi:MAG: SgcJ/EcaC family oxidoreductase [Hymenobacteraceae bacterium]|nr:SgcJ/EcaC family oxidoreductase [Hymenobacteraceae bacterium]MDX5482152.1 SgcJ/EcaC family oxidoreductase [Hymenobacteraceae bacterium]